ncbi:MAG: urea carboxylase, partial [Pseudomonadota bacterium]
MIETILIANRGEIACRIIATLRRMGRRAVAVYSEADRHAAHTLMADEAVVIGKAPAADSYLNIDRLVEACRASGATAVHPGYGFLSESADFAEALAAEGIVFIGPSADHIRLFGRKHAAREAAVAAGVPLLPGTGLLSSLEEAQDAAPTVGFPLMVKATAGGGGIGLAHCARAEDLADCVTRVTRLGAANFADGAFFLEAFVETARHVEVQIFGDGKGRVMALGERDCSLQRRNQKVIEETPAPNLPDATRAQMMDAAVRLGQSVDYASAGTVEFVYDEAKDRFAFLEVNTRLQVEHPVTEAVTGIDLVEWMVRQAEGSLDLQTAVIDPAGAAIEARIYAEDPARAFRPSAGRITHVSVPDGVRVDTFVSAGSDVPAHYDPLLAKVIVRGDNRAEAVAALNDALSRTKVGGIATNLDYLAQIAASPLFGEGRVSTRALDTFAYRPRTVEVLSPGAQSTLQDWPGRTGYWHVGVPPSGPMDALSHRLANRIVGNADDAAALEMTMTGATLRFSTAATIALTGADMGATVDGAPVPLYAPFAVAEGATLAMGPIKGPGMRTVLAVRGGFDCPSYLGAKATFTLGGFGGHAVGALKTGDVVAIAPMKNLRPPTPAPFATPLTDAWTLRVLYGPHGAPDFFTEEDIAALLSSAYTVGVNSARTGVRLSGPKPTFARDDGGEAGLHPSNIHDNAYAVGAVDFTGDMPIILGPDGPSLGGFVCPFVVAKADLWMVGQLRPGDRVRFAAITLAEADAAERAQEASLATGEPLQTPTVVSRRLPEESTVRRTREDGEIKVVYRRTGQDNLLVEFGENVLDLDLRVRAHSLMERLTEAGVAGIEEITPGIRSLQVRYDDGVITEGRLLDLVDGVERDLPAVADVVVPSRIVSLPLAFDDSQTRLASERYQANVRPDAPWCPWNLEFIRRINGLDDIDAVRDIVFAADYCVYGLGDVYLGAPVATPLDPRHRLVTTKYNPARTWTPENAVGIGGAYLCIYGMEGPGGYQFVGRTVQVWNTHRQTSAFRDGVPWLLRFFDRIRFFPVSEPDLLEMRAAFPHGRYEVQIEDGALCLAEHHKNLEAAGDEIAAFRARREAAFARERAAWQEAGLTPPEEVAAPDAPPKAHDGEGPVVVASLPGIVWRVEAAPG